MNVSITQDLRKKQQLLKRLQENTLSRAGDEIERLLPQIGKALADPRRPRSLTLCFTVTGGQQRCPTISVLLRRSITRACARQEI
jgi:hypothetical protein